MNNFDSVCTQSPIETEYAINYHNIHPQKICKLGMLWLRNIELINANIAQPHKKNELKKTRIILYAGISSSYFSKASELQAIDEILAAIKNKSLPNAKLIYRPVTTADELRVIFDKYRNEKEIEIQIPQQSLIGMKEYSKSSVKTDIIEYLKTISSIDLLVMSAGTTLSLDVLYFDKPVISYFFDPYSELQRGGYNKLKIKQDVLGFFSSGLPVVSTSPTDLVKKIKEVLDKPFFGHQMKRNILGRWDYQNQNYVSEFINLINRLKQ